MTKLMLVYIARSTVNVGINHSLTQKHDCNRLPQKVDRQTGLSTTDRPTDRHVLSKGLMYESLLAPKSDFYSQNSSRKEEFIERYYFFKLQINL